MNTQNFNQTGGFPLETNTLAEMQTAYSIFNAMGNMAGNRTILNGCVLAGSTVSDGVVFIDGEVFQFRGGIQQSKVVIREDIISKPFENGENKEVLRKRYVTFGTGLDDIDWASFVRINPIREIQNMLVPSGLISMWSGTIANIPNGWFLCDGQNGTPDLQGKFIAGYDPDETDMDTIGKEGGIENNTPSGTVNNRTISINISRDGWGTSGGGFGVAQSGRLVVGSGIAENAEALESLRVAAAGKRVTSTHNHNFTGNEMDNRPPFYTLAYIIKG